MRKGAKKPKAVFSVMNFDSGIYPFKFAFLIGDWDQDFVEDYLKRIKLWNGEGEAPAPDDDGYKGCMIRFQGGGFVHIKGTLDTIEAQDTLVHEITHVVGHMGRMLGFKHGEDAEEFYAYMSGWLFGTVMTNYKESCKMKAKRWKNRAK